MNALRKEIEKRIERVVDVWSKDVADDNDWHESGRLEDEGVLYPFFWVFISGKKAMVSCFQRRGLSRRLVI